MPIIFISLNELFCEKIREKGFETKLMRIQDYIPNPHRKTFYVSPANSLCFMDGGMDYALSRVVFPGIEPLVRKMVRDLGHQSIVGKYYLPIGSSLIIDGICSANENKYLVVSPTMLLPQNVSGTRNAYYAMMATLCNILINRGENLDNVDILLTSFCCGYGKMDEETSIQQMMDGIRDYHNYRPQNIRNNLIWNEPNLLEQPKYYQNTEWFSISPQDIVNC